MVVTLRHGVLYVLSSLEGFPAWGSYYFLYSTLTDKTDKQTPSCAL